MPRSRVVSAFSKAEQRRMSKPLKIHHVALSAPIAITLLDKCPKCGSPDRTVVQLAVESYDVDRDGAPISRPHRNGLHHVSDVECRACGESITRPVGT